MPPKGTKKGTSKATRDTGNEDASQAQASTHVSVSQRHRAVDLLRELIRPHVTTRELLEFYLTGSNWDIDAAYQQYTTDAEAVEAENAAEQESNGDGSESDSDSAGDVDDDTEPAHVNASKIQGEGDVSGSGDSVGRRLLAALPSRANVEQERRDTALAFRQHIFADTAGTVKLSRTESILLLHLSGWDISRAVERFKSFNSALRKLYEAHGTVVTASTRKNQVQQDEMLALLIEITDRPDWWSLLQFLISAEWDLVDALVEWYRNGIPMVRHPRDAPRFKKTKGGSLGHGAGRRVDHQLNHLPAPSEAEVQAQPDPDEEGWEDDLAHFDQYAPTTADPKQSDSDVPRESISAPSRKRAKGFIINNPKGTILVGASNPRRLLCEYIQKGNYRINRFRNAKFVWPGMAEGEEDDDQEADNEEPTTARKDKEKKVPFDWHDASHTSLLDSFWRQNSSRITGTIKRNRSMPMSQAENDFLYKLTKEYVEELTKKYGMRPRLPVVVPNDVKERWFQLFNKEFEGTQPAGAHTVRRQRSKAAIMAARGRNKALVRDFKVSKTERVKKAAKSQVNPASSKRPAETEEDSQAQPKAKKQKTSDDAANEEGEAESAADDADESGGSDEEDQ